MSVIMDLLDIWALIADLLLSHLESARAHLPGDHLLPAIALPGALRGLHHRLIPGQLDEIAQVEFLQSDPQIDDHVGAPVRLPLAPVFPPEEVEPEVPEEAAEGVASPAPAALLIETLFPAFVVQLAFIGVREGLVSRPQVLEAFVGRRVVGVSVRVHFFG